MGDNTEQDTPGRSAPPHTLAADERAIEPLVSFLRSHDTELRRSAATALGQYGDPNAVEALSETAARDWDSEVRRCAVEALGRSGGPSVITPLVKALADGAETVRDAAEGALARVGGPAVPSLIDALSYREMMIRRGAAAALGRIADERGVAPLIRVLRGQESEVAVCRAAAAALGEVASRRPTPLLRDALPVLRRLTERDPLYRRVMRQIEAATAGVRHLPVPAANPPPPADQLPVPANPPPFVPDDSAARAKASWRGGLRRALRRWTSPGT